MKENNYQKVFEDLGLTKSEIAVYFALLDLETPTTGEIIKKAQISSGKIYLILDKLINKGLITYSIKANTKHFSANSPERLYDYFNEKKENLKKIENKLKEIIPELQKKYESKEEKVVSEIYEGIKGFKAFHEFMLQKINKDETLYVLGAPKEANDLFGNYYKYWNKQRVKKGFNLKILYSSTSRRYGEVRKKLPLTQVKYFPENLDTPTWIDIFQDYVVTIYISKEPRCFLIKDKTAAISYKKYFDLMWKNSIE